MLNCINLPKQAFTPPMFAFWCSEAFPKLPFYCFKLLQNSVIYAPWAAFHPCTDMPVVPFLLLVGARGHLSERCIWLAVTDRKALAWSWWDKEGTSIKKGTLMGMAKMTVIVAPIPCFTCKSYLARHHHLQHSALCLRCLGRWASVVFHSMLTF